MNSFQIMCEHNRIEDAKRWIGGPRGGDPTERTWHNIASHAQAFERAATEATSVGRLVQLHERLMACVATLENTDDLVRERWDRLLADGQD